MCILSVYTLLTVVGYCDLSVLSMSVMGFQKKIGWCVSGVSSIEFYFGILLTLQSPLLMPVYSLGAWAIDESSPLDPALRHGDNFLPGVPHFLHTSESMSRRHVFLARPFFLFPWGFSVRACLVRLDSGFLSV